MKNIFIATIGTRDVKVEDNFIKNILLKAGDEEAKFIDNQNVLARPWGKLLQRKDIYNEFKQHYGLPILTPVLNYITDDIDQLFFVITDQEDPEFKISDTIEYGKLISKLLTDKDWNRVKKVFHTGNIGKPILIHDNVIYLDAQFVYFNNLLKQKNKFTSKLEEADRIFLCTQGGIDAINNGLTLNLLNKFGDKVVIYNVNEKNSNCTEIKIHSRLEKERIKKLIFDLLRTYNYASIVSVESIPPDVKVLAEYAKNRLYFNFDVAIKSLDKISPALRSKADKFKEEINEPDENTLLTELYFNAKIKWKQQAYVDFLLRFFRIVEAIAKKEAIVRLTGFEPEQHKWDKDFSKYLEENIALKEFLDHYKLHGSKLNYLSKNPNIEVYLAILNFYSGNDDKAKRAANLITKLKPLSQMRNNSIGAHSFNPVSLELIEQELRKEYTDFNSSKMFLEIEQYLEVSDNPFDRTNELIIKIYDG